MLGVLQDERLRGLLFSFLGLQQVYSNAERELMAMRLFATLAKTQRAGKLHRIRLGDASPMSGAHGRRGTTAGQGEYGNRNKSLFMCCLWVCLVGSDVVPETYQAYYMICAQLFGPEKAAALLHAPLTVRHARLLRVTRTHCILD